MELPRSKTTVIDFSFAGLKTKYISLVCDENVKNRLSGVIVANERYVITMSVYAPGKNKLNLIWFLLD